MNRLTVDHKAATFPLKRLTPSPASRAARASRCNLTIYDAVYVALAELLDAPLWTLDQRLAGAPGLRAEVKVIQ